MRALSGRRAAEKKSEADLENTGSAFGGQMPSDEAGAEEDEEDTKRQIFVNQRLPPELLDEDGAPLHQFSRNKIRTARYTPLIFIPKNLWLQFHNIANVYFLFVTILQV
jgi:phospholipid-translocating ATPase